MCDNSCILIVGLNSYKRQIIHQECENLKLFHWTKKIDEKNSNFIVSNRLVDKKHYIKAKRQYETKNKTIEMRLNEINSDLGNNLISINKYIC